MEREVANVRRALWTTALALALSLVFSLVPGFSAWFSVRVSLPLAALASRAAAFAEWPVGEVLILAGVPVLILLALWSALRRRAPRGPALTLALAFLSYAILWTPLVRAPAEASAPYETWRLMKLCQTLSAQANALRGEAALIHGSPAETLSMARDAVASIGVTSRPLQKPKFSRYPQILRSLRIAGAYLPWTGEAIVSPEEPAFTLPFLASHELAHAAGIAREDEANFVAYRACMTGDARFQYAGTIYALSYSMDALRAVDMDKWFDIRRGFSAGVRDDFTRIDDVGGAATGIAALSDRAAEAFLRLGGQKAGLQSYAGMVGFLLADVSLVEKPETLQREDAIQYID